MKLLFSEFSSDYDKYEFPYQVYGLREVGDKASNIYNLGFLPTRIDKDLFYLCRSVRIDLSDLSLNSENRRIKKKTGYLKAELIALEEFDYDITIGKMAKEFSKERFSESYLSPRATRKLFTESSMTHVLRFTDQEGNKIIGYCLCLYEGDTFHYSYPFYDTNYVNRNMGMGMIVQAIEIALETEARYLYLGTCYTESSMYKLQFDKMEYYTGFGWSEDIESLKQLVRTPINDHLFKHVEDKGSFLDLFRDVE